MWDREKVFYLQFLLIRLNIFRNIENKNEVKVNDKEEEAGATHAKDTIEATDARDAHAYLDVHTINNEKDRE